MNPVITIDNFDGPLDLLLTLIKKNNMSIYDVNLIDVIDQYICYINEMQDLNLNVAAEYLVMAAELIEIKSRSLLPNKKEENVEEEDPKEKLISRLIEYQKYKELTDDFKVLQEQRNLIWTKSPENLNMYSENEVVVNDNLDINILMDALTKMLERLDYDKPLTTKITNKELSIKDRRVEIVDKLKVKNKLNFIELFDIFTKEYIVVTFLAILNMARKEEIDIKQDKCFEDIIIELRSINE